MAWHITVWLLLRRRHLMASFSWGWAAWLSTFVVNRSACASSS